MLVGANLAHLERLRTTNVTGLVEGTRVKYVVVLMPAVCMTLVRKVNYCNCLLSS